MLIRAAKHHDAEAIADIYNYYIANTIITFEEQLVDAQEMRQRIITTQQQFPYLVCEEQGQVCGYAYATAWRPRSAYRYSVESTIYLDKSVGGKGIGTALYQALIEALRTGDVHCILGGIALPNAASVALHEKLGFKLVGQLPQVGRKFNQWIDVGYWQYVFTQP